MAQAAAAAPYSNYVYSLSQEMKFRHLTKIAIINGQDLYALNNGEFTKDQEQLTLPGYIYIVGTEPQLLTIFYLVILTQYCIFTHIKICSVTNIS